MRPLLVIKVAPIHFICLIWIITHHDPSTLNALEVVRVEVYSDPTIRADVFATDSYTFSQERVEAHAVLTLA